MIKGILALFLLVSLTSCGTDNAPDTAAIISAGQNNQKSPSANGFAAGISIRNPLAWHYINNLSEITVTLSDAYGRPATNGTTISFMTNGGQIQLADNDVATCAIQEGDCSVKWESGPPYPTSGIAGILVYVEGGDEAFNDTNQNAVYDIGETYTSLPEPYLDANQNNVYDTNETFIDINSNGSWDNTSTNQAFRGGSCSAQALMAGHCANKATLFFTTNIVMSTQASTFVLSPTAGDASGSPARFSISMVDQNGNTPAKDSIFDSINCNSGLIPKVLAPTLPSTIPEAFTNSFSWTIEVTSPDSPVDGNNADGETGICLITYKDPSGATGTQSFTVVY